MNALGLLLRLDIRGHYDLVTTRLAVMQACLLDEVEAHYRNITVYFCSYYVYMPSFCSMMVVDYCQCHGCVARDHRRADVKELNLPTGMC